MSLQRFDTLPVNTPGLRARRLSMRPGDELIMPEDGSAPTQFKRKVIKQRMVTETHDVKVPCMIPRVVECTYERKVPIKKLVQVTNYELVEETYTDFEEQVVTEERKVWVQEEGEPEVYTEKVAVEKYRTVQVPCTRIVEEEDETPIEIEETVVEQVVGWRIDEVEDRRVVEVEEWEIFELIPTATGETIEGEKRELGLVDAGKVNRIMGEKIYKASELDQAREDGHDIDNLPVDHSQDVEAHADAYLNNDGYTGDRGDGPEMEKAALSYGAPVSDEEEEEGAGAVDEGFDLDKCLAYTRAELRKFNDPNLDVDEFVDQLESRWRFVDADAGGLVELEELRLAVWNTEEDNAGIPMPKGRFPKALQDIVDEIYVGTGSKPAFNIWDFVQFMLNEQLLEHISIKTPPRSEAWAHAE